VLAKWDEREHVRLSVKDVGIGFEPQTADRLFEPFYRTKDGMGIGLAVSKSIIESHHCRLWAETNDGPGATSSFSIPWRREECLRPTACIHPAGVLGSFHDKHGLVVDQFHIAALSAPVILLYRMI
jgi:hypothetical protein